MSSDFTLQSRINNREPHRSRHSLSSFPYFKTGGGALLDHKREHFPQSKQSIKSCDLSHRHGDFTADARNATLPLLLPRGRRENLRHACRPLDFLSLIPPFNLSRSRHASISAQCISVALSARGGTDGKLLRPCLPLAPRLPRTNICAWTSARSVQRVYCFSPLVGRPLVLHV